MRCGWIPVLVWGSAGMIARVPLNALLVLCFCVAQNVAIGTWDWEAGGRSSARADTCGELESLFHNAIVEDIMVEGRIVVRECVWRRRRMPNREVRLHGGVNGALDFRGLNGDAVLHTDGVIGFEALKILHEVRVEGANQIVILPVDGGAQVNLRDVVLWTGQCVLNGVSWPQQLVLSEYDSRYAAVCHSRDGGVQLKGLVLSSSDTCEIHVESAHMYCEDMENYDMQSEHITSCKQELARDNLWQSRKYVIVGLTLAGAILLIALVYLICIAAVKKLKQKMLSTRHSMHNAAVDVVSDFLASAGNGQKGTISFKDLELGGVIGRGGFSTVYHGKFQGNPVAVKIIEHRSPCAEYSKQSFEAYISSTVSHPNIVRGLSYKTFTGNQCPSGFKSSDSVHMKVVSTSTTSDVFDMVELSCRTSDKDFLRTWLVMEYCNLGSMADAVEHGLLHMNEEKTLPHFQHITLAAIDVANAMEHLHAAGIIHGDLKSQNVLLKESSSDERGYCCKVCDFGFSRLAPNMTHIQTFTCGSVSAMPPEMFRDGYLAKAADVYSFGILLWELLSGRPPYQGWSHQAIMHEVVEGHRPQMCSEWPDAFRNLICSCLHQEHWSRPTFPEILDCLKNNDGECNVLLLTNSKPTEDPLSTGTFFSCTCSVHDSCGQVQNAETEIEREAVKNLEHDIALFY